VQTIRDSPRHPSFRFLQGKEFQLVATSVSDRSEIERVENPELRSQLSMQRDVYLELLRAAQRNVGEIVEIKEDVIMKWREQIVVGIERDTAYERLAAAIVRRMNGSS
jgi:hypothetical protein